MALPSTLPACVTWTEELDQYIPVALNEARNKFDGDILQRSKEVLEQARKAMIRKFSRLRRSLTAEVLTARIATLNANTPTDNPNYIWIVNPPNIKRKELTTTDEPVVPTTVPATPSQMPPLQVVQQILPETTVTDLTAAISCLSSHQADTVDTLRLLFEEVCRLNTNLLAQNGMLHEQNGNLQTLLAYYKDREKQIGRSQLSKKETQAVKRPVLLRNGRIIDVTREDVCWGEEWDKISAKPLSASERAWQEVFEFCMRTVWLRRNFKHADGGAIAVYGRDTDLSEIQLLFHHLNPQRIVWVSTTFAQDLDEVGVGDVTPANGMVAIIVHKGATTNAVHAVEEKCKGYGIRHMTLYDKLRPGYCTDPIAHFLTSKPFKQELAEIHSDRTGRRV